MTRGDIMSRKKRNFMRAGAIGNLIEAGFFVLIAVVLLSLMNSVTDEVVVIILKDLKFVKVIGIGGDAYRYVDPSGLDLTLSSENISAISAGFRNWMYNTSMSMLFTAVINIIFNIVVLVQANKNIDKKWAVIVCLITSILASNWVCMAFFIVVLCLGSKKQQVESVEKANNE